MQIPILVTGGAGYVGAHTCKTLAQCGFLPVTLDNFSRGHRDFVRWGPLVEADISDQDAVIYACSKFNIVAAVHFAGYGLVGESMSDPARYYQNNVAGTLSLLAGLHKAGVKSIVFSSSCAVYGSPEKLPIDEDTPLLPENPYGATKVMAERILSDSAQAYGLNFIALRYFNAAGADPDSEIGELREIETHLIPRAMMWLLGHLDEFQVLGTNYPTQDGTAVRDYVHVCDLAEAHVYALKKLLSGAAGGIYNLGTGRGYSVRQVLAEIERTTGQAIPETQGERRPGDPATLVADPARAHAQLGFKASRSDLKNIIDSAWAWHQKAHPRRR